MRTVALWAAVCWAAWLSHNAQAAIGLLENHVNVAFEFENGLEGWANSTSEEMQAEVHPLGGEMAWEIRESAPHADSPLMITPTTDQNYVVTRMKYSGSSASTVGSFYFRAGNTLPPAQYAKGRAVWNLTTAAQQWEVEFGVIPDGQYHVYYVPLYPFKYPIPAMQYNLTQMRIRPVKFGLSGQAVKIDWIRVVRAPTILMVEGCSNLPVANAGQSYVLPTQLWTRRTGALNQYFNLSTQALTLRGLGTESSFNKTYGVTYNCRREGGDRITITGHNFGVSGARVTINGKPCTSLTHDVAETVVSCTAPAGTGVSVNVTIANGQLPLLRETKPFFSYTVGPASPLVMNYSNIGARHMDLTWRVAPDLWDAYTTTGYWIERRAAVSGPASYVNRPYNASEWVWGDWKEPVTTTNITTTTIIGLKASTRYQFRIAALNEDVVFSNAWQGFDMYGRRPPVPNYVLGPWFYPPEVVATLDFDFKFPLFNANLTLNYGPMDKRASNGMIGETIGEGHYGLVIMGDTNVENCNQTTSCCDGYNASAPIPFSSCNLACSTVARLRPPYINNIAMRARMFYPIPTPDPDPLKRGVPGNASYVQPALLPALETLFPNGIRMGDPMALARPPTYICGPTLRITPSQARRTGAVWYNRKQQVREGFDTTFRYRISNPSVRCTFMDDVYTQCRSRGGEGFAFVIHNDNAVAMGQPNSGLGYQGIRNAIAIEFDTWYNPELLDPWENHVAVITRGWRDVLSPNHTYELGHSTTAVPDLTDGIITVRVTYSPKFDLDSLSNVGFVNDAPHTLDFITNGNFARGGFGDWGIGMGVLKIFFNNETRPSLSVPLNLDQTIVTDNGRSYVGFTAATGESVWQTHDLVSWYWTQSREDIVPLRASYPRIET